MLFCPFPVAFWRKEGVMVEFGRFLFLLFWFCFDSPWCFACLSLCFVLLAISLDFPYLLEMEVGPGEPVLVQFVFWDRPRSWTTPSSWRS